MRERSPFEVLFVFLQLGITSFGGPVAHIGYFREALIVRRGWLDDAAYTDLVALCQFLPGPASSQVAFALGLNRAGYWGGLAAWVGFTLPSAVLMTAFALGVRGLDGTLGRGALHGLELVAVAIVAQAVLGMARTLCPDRQRAAIACIAALLVLFSRSAAAPIATIVFGGITGLWLCRVATPMPVGTLGMPVSRRVGILALGTFGILLVALPSIGGASQPARLFDAFYRAGALVFGGGHVMLPLLSETFVGHGWVAADAFLAGYGAAQAMPGPLFTFAAYLGAVAGPTPLGISGAALGLAAIFLPGTLILVGTLPFWDEYRQRVGAQAVMRGINAAVVGLLGAALYHPLWTSAVKTPGDVAVALLGLFLLSAWRIPPLIVVILSALGGMARA